MSCIAPMHPGSSPARQDVYPVFLTGLSQRCCVVIGGGQEAEHKVRGLLAATAAVTVISPQLMEQLQMWAAAGDITWVPRRYQPGDLQDAFLVLVTESDAQTTVHIKQEAEAVRALLNMEDDTVHSTFIAGSVVRQGPLTLAISTSGCAPALAVRLRQRFEAEFGPEYAAFLDLMRERREPLAHGYPDFEARRERWYRLVDSDILGLLRQEAYELARRRAAAIIAGEHV